MNVWVGDTRDFIDLTWLSVRQDSEEEELLKGIHDFFCVLAILVTKALPKTFLLLVLVLRFLASGSKLDGSKISTFLSGQRTSEKPSVTPVGSGCKTSSCWFGKGSEPLSLFSNPQEPERKQLVVACYLSVLPDRPVCQGAPGQHGKD